MVEMGLVDPAWEPAPRDPRVPAWPEAPYPEWQKRAMEVYAAMVDRMDRGIGLIVSALEATDRLDSTVIMFLSDNGGCAEGGTAFTKEGRTSGLSCQLKLTRDGRPVHFGHYAQHLPGPPDTYQEYGRPWANASNTPFRLYKHQVHEGGIATPLIVHWPDGLDAGPPGGALVREPGHVIDVLPTCVELAGATYPAGVDGREIVPAAGLSLLPALRGGALAREALFWEHEGNRAVRRGRWKLVARGRKGAWELYDMAADRTEQHDLAAQRGELVAELAAMWQAWAKRTGVLPWPR
jgi:arylsulfatase